MQQQHTAQRRGQGQTEYLLVVTLIAIGSIGVASFFGTELRSLFGVSSGSLAGQEQKAEAPGVQRAGERKDLVSFGQNSYPGGVEPTPRNADN